MKPSKYKYGDIFEIKTKKGLAYLQYVNSYDKPPYYGQLVRILDGIFDKRPTDYSQIVNKKELYYIFIPLDISVKRREILLVGHEKVSDNFKKMPVFRVAGIGNPRTWISNSWNIWDGDKETNVGILENKYHNVNSLGTWNIRAIIQNIEIDWMPKDDVHLIGWKKYYDKFFPQVAKEWQQFVPIIEKGNIEEIVRETGNKSLELIRKYKMGNITKDQLSARFYYHNLLVRYYCLNELDNAKFQDILNRYQKILKDLSLEVFEQSKKKADLDKLQEICNKMLNYK